MTKSSRKRRRQPGRPTWPVLVFVGILLVAAAILLALNPFGRKSAETGSGAPQIAVEPDKIDYGYVKFGNNEQIKIKVTNRGAGPLRFAETPYIEVLEGC